MTRPSIPLDMSGFESTPEPKTRPTKDQVEALAAESGFTTRHASRQYDEPKATAGQAQEPMRRGRKRTTNRNTPFAVKLKLETNNAIYRLAEELECNAIAEVIERAIAALEREISHGEK